MKTIGLIGGMSWESSAEYYRLINEAVRDRLGGTHSAQSLMFSVDFAEIEALQVAGDWVTAADRMVDAARRLQRGGADCIVLCTNTMHRCAPRIEAEIALPFIHIVDPTAQAIQEADIQRIGLLGTRYTMEQDFYKGRLSQKFGVDVITPEEAERILIHDVIYQELVLGKINERSRDSYQRIIKTLADRGAQGVILGCTEITLLIKPEHSVLPVFDTTMLHALAAVDFALGITQAA